MRVCEQCGCESYSKDAERQFPYMCFEDFHSNLMICAECAIKRLGQS